jgi:transcription antitermination factor NusA-like protein
MQTPLCSICLENDDILCNGCRAKLEDGDITQEEVELSRLLSALSTDIDNLQDVVIKQAVPTADAVVIVTEEGDGPKVVGRNGRVVKKIAEHFDKSIRVVEDTGDMHAVLEKLLAPVEYESINKVYKPDGEEKKVVVDESQKPRVPFSKDEFEDLMDDLTGESLHLSFE